MARLCDEHTVVCALQNGVEQVERVGRFCPSSTVVPAAVWFSAERQPDGWVRLRTEARLVLPDTEAAATLAELLRGAGMTVELEPDFTHRRMAQAAGQRGGRLHGADRPRAGMFRRDDVAALARRYLAECLAVARAEGANLGDEVIDEIVGMLGAGARGS